MEVPKYIPFLVRPLYLDKGFLQQKYEVEKLSAKEISTVISSSRSTVLKYLKQFGINLRPNDCRNKTRSQLRYGEAWRKRSVTRHYREIQNIEKMKALRAQGFSYWKIAAVFNSMRIPTKTGRGRWHARAIQKILALLTEHQD